MKVSDLPEDSNLSKVQVEIPDDLLKNIREYYPNHEGITYVIGYGMGDFWISVDPPGGKRDLIPMSLFPSFNSRDILDWKILE